MSTPRKNKVAKANEERDKRKIVMPKATIDDKAIAQEQIAQLNTHHDNGRVLNAATVTAEKQQMPQIQAQAEVQNPTGLAGKNAMSKGALPQLDNIRAQAEVQNPTGLAGAENKPKTWSDLLAEQREQLKQDKTDAVKMQKYHALSDVLRAIGQMGGSAIGGAIGGSALESAPAVGEYKESRGYLDALERAKQANERLRALDDKGFQLALRDEERSYEQQQRKLDKDYQMKMKKLDAEIRAAEAEKDFQRRAQLEKEILALKNEYEVNMENLRAENEQTIRQMIINGDLESKRIGQETVKLQMTGKGSGNAAGRFTGKNKPVLFKGNVTIDMPEDAYKEIRDSLINQEVGGIDVDKDNVDRVIRDNPELITEMLIGLGVLERPESALTTHSYNRYKDESVKSPTGLAKNFNGPDPYDDDEYNIYARK